MEYRRNRGCAYIDPAPLENRNAALASVGIAARWTLGTFGNDFMDAWLLQAGSDYLAWIVYIGKQDEPRNVWDVPCSHIWRGQAGDLQRCLEQIRSGEDEEWESLFTVTSADFLKIVGILEKEAIDAYQARVRCQEPDGDPWITIERQAARAHRAQQRTQPRPRAKAQRGKHG